MSALVEKLSRGEHPVSLIRYKDMAGFKQALERGFVLVKFTQTQGGTEIGVSLENNDRGIDLESKTVNLRGSLTLDYQPVRCIASVDLETLTGYGCLEMVKAG
jgi:hypothetical protein